MPKVLYASLLFCEAIDIDARTGAVSLIDLRTTVLAIPLGHEGHGSTHGALFGCVYIELEVEGGEGFAVVLETKSKRKEPWTEMGVIQVEPSEGHRGRRTVMCPSDNPDLVCPPGSHRVRVMVDGVEVVRRTLEAVKAPDL